MTKFHRLLMVATSAAALLGAAGARAATLTGAITADNEYSAYLSTSDDQLGSLLATGANWQSAQTFSADLIAGQTYYLHVVANNFGGPSDMNGGNPDALLGSFDLTGTGFSFANGQQSLDTDTTDWRASPSDTVQDLGGSLSWTAPTGAPVSFGANGSGVWGSNLSGPVGGVRTSANWIWSATDPSGEAFFSTTITAGGAVPEPAAWALMILGFGMTGATLRRRRPVLARAV